jgi:3-isopropylmalate/(R)-2-methylmalate dehydratase small subunit
MREEITGKVWKLGDDINTDVIFPGKYTYTISDPSEMAKHALEDINPGFAEKVQKDDIIIAGSNFGCGSSREQAALCLKAAGIGAVVAKSFSRIYFRNAINLGLPIVICPQVVHALKSGDQVTINFQRGKIIHQGEEYTFPPLSEDIAKILDAGGLIPYVQKKLGLNK